MKVIFREGLHEVIRLGGKSQLRLTQRTGGRAQRPLGPLPPGVMDGEKR